MQHYFNIVMAREIKRLQTEPTVFQSSSEITSSGRPVMKPEKFTFWRYGKAGQKKTSGHPCFPFSCDVYPHPTTKNRFIFVIYYGRELSESSKKYEGFFDAERPDILTQQMFLIREQMYHLATVWDGLDNCCRVFRKK